MSIHVSDAQLVSQDAPRFQARTRAETHALGFLSRYRVEHTRASYEIALRQWFGFCSENGIADPLEATRVDIELFARELELTGRKLATVGGKLNVLAGFYRYAVLDGLIEDNPMLNVVRPPVQRTSTTLGLTRSEFADVLKEAEGHPPRDHAVICLLGLNGMRVSEVVGIDIDDLGRHQGHRTVRILRKGGKYQILPMAPRTTWQVELAAGDRTTGPLLLDHTGTKRIDRRTAARIVARITLAAGIRKRITPHSLRHTFVTLSLDSGATDRDVAASVGHADTRLVAYYDRGRESIARNTTYGVASFVEGAG